MHDVSCHHRHTDGPPNARVVARSLSEAEARLTGQGQRLTEARRRVLELLLAVGEPVKAYDLIAQFGTDGQPAKPPTVYRALEFLERQGLVHRIASISAYVACAGHEGDHTAAFVICDCCGATQELAGVVTGPLETAAANLGYVVTRATMEAHGRCRDCQG